MQLTKNFHLSEFTRSNTARLKGIDNTPDLHVINNLRKLSENILQPLRDQYGPIIITSGYRSPELNTAINGSRTSQHMGGFAADIECLNLSNYDLAKAIVNDYDFDQLILEFYVRGNPHSGWVHVSYDESRMRYSLLTATKINGRVRYLTGLHY